MKIGTYILISSQLLQSVNSTLVPAGQITWSDERFALDAAHPDVWEHHL